MKKLLLASSLLGILTAFPTAHAAVVVDWNSPTYTTGALTIPAPQVDGTGTQRTYQYSDSTALYNPEATPSGKSGKFYGAATVIAPTSAALTATTAQSFTIASNATADRISYTFVAPGMPGATHGGTYTFAAFTFFKKENFLSGSASTLTFDSTCDFSTTIATFNPSSGSTRNARVAVQDGAQWYVSSGTISATGLQTLTDLTLQNWAAWDPTGNTMALAPTLGFSAHTFTDIQALGVYAQVSKNLTVDTNFSFIMETLSIGAVAVPEPSTGLLLGIGAIFAGLVRRNKKCATDSLTA